MHETMTETAPKAAKALKAKAKPAKAAPTTRAKGDVLLPYLKATRPTGDDAGQLSAYFQAAEKALVSATVAKASMEVTVGLASESNWAAKRLAEVHASASVTIETPTSYKVVTAGAIEGITVITNEHGEADVYASSEMDEAAAVAALEAIPEAELSEDAAKDALAALPAETENTGNSFPVAAAPAPTPVWQESAKLAARPYNHPLRPFLPWARPKPNSLVKLIPYRAAVAKAIHDITATSLGADAAAEMEIRGKLWEEHNWTVERLWYLNPNVLKSLGYSKQGGGISTPIPLPLGEGEPAFKPAPAPKAAKAPKAPKAPKAAAPEPDRAPEVPAAAPAATTADLPAKPTGMTSAKNANKGLVAKIDQVETLGKSVAMGALPRIQALAELQAIKFGTNSYGQKGAKYRDAMVTYLETGE
jgi:hypothetical protein